MKIEDNILNEVLEGSVQKMNDTASAAAADPVREDAPGLVKRKQPYYLNQQERPAHRLMLELAAKGYDVKEIAERMGKSAVCVNNILRQPALQQVLVNDIRKEVTEDEQVVKIIRENVVAACNLYKSIMEDKDARNCDRLAAADRFMERRYGKANQPVNKDNAIDLDSLSIQELAASLPITQKTTTS